MLLRARQNVTFELGFFIGALGRERVCALHKGKVEIPSDFSGVLWIRIDPEGAWQLKLAREIKAAGFEVDLNKLM
ncbi:MAG: TIR domain-containing protein [Anaerolineales bacterium]